jgi:hypothetical protein
MFPLRFGQKRGILLMIIVGEFQIYEKLLGWASAKPEHFATKYSA